VLKLKSATTRHKARAAHLKKKLEEKYLCSQIQSNIARLIRQRTAGVCKKVNVKCHYETHYKRKCDIFTEKNVNDKMCDKETTFSTELINEMNQ
jgi:hypothetical protein